jgi:hypothetical protein
MPNDPLHMVRFMGMIPLYGFGMAMCSQLFKMRIRRVIWRGDREAIQKLQQAPRARV